MDSEIVIPAPDRDKKTAGHGWLGIPAVMAAVATNLRFFAARRPSTPLRVLSLIAISAALRSRGTLMDPERRRAVIEAMELGALLNDRFDGDAHDSGKLRESVAWFAQSPHRHVVRNYAKRLRHLERARPVAGESAAAVRVYRENVNRVSLAVLWALASRRSLADATLEIEREADLRLLFQMVMLCQLIDDVLDIHEDRRRGLPAFGTGAGGTASSLCELISVYENSNLVSFDRNFCLRLTLKLIAAGTRAVIGIRRHGVQNRPASRPDPG
jgi:hypothetical protein